jgi:hypothetical protein
MIVCINTLLGLLDDKARENLEGLWNFCSSLADFEE